MKKIGLLVLALSLASSAFAGTLKVGASPAPHAEILHFAGPLLEKEGIVLDVVEFTDYVLPNLSLAQKDLDANFFQHVPYLESFAKERGLDLVSLGAVHLEPMALFSQKLKSLDELKDGASIAIPSDATNGGRALLLLQKLGLIKLAEGVGLEATELDVAENPKKFKFTALEAAQLARVLPDVDVAVINGNYALEGGLKLQDALAHEDGQSPYANILAVRKGDESREDLQKLLSVLQGPEVAAFIEKQYDGAVLPVNPTK